MQLKVTDSNKENLTPSSSYNSNAKSSLAEGTLKVLRENTRNLITSMEQSKNEYFKLVKGKEDLSKAILEKDSALFKEKTEMEYLNDILREKERKKSSLLENINSYSNMYLEQNLLSTPFTVEKAQANDSTVRVKLGNGVTLTGARQNSNGAYALTSIASLDPTNAQGMSGILEKEFNIYPELITLYAAFNIN